MQQHSVVDLYYTLKSLYDVQTTFSVGLSHYSAFDGYSPLNPATLDLSPDVVQLIKELDKPFSATDTDTTSKLTIVVYKENKIVGRFHQNTNDYLSAFDKDDLRKFLIKHINNSTKHTT
jgi:hypothetical protein